MTAEALSCESSPEVDAAQRELYKKLETATFEQMPSLREQAYKTMRQLDPTDYRPIRQYVWFLYYYRHEQLDSFRAKAAAEARSS